MTRKRFDIIDVIVALIVGTALGIFATFCFSSPSSEARFHCEGSGFIENNGPKRQTTQTLAELPPPSVSKVGKQQSRPTLLVTAYCPCEKCCGKWAKVYPRKTASGHIIEPNDCFVAAPPEYPFWTYLTIEGYADDLPVPVLDRGGAIQGNKLDVFFGGKDGHEKALVWGVKYLRIGK